MSRTIDYNDDWTDVADLLAAGRWDKNTRATLKSKRGQQALREMEAALLALPKPRLIEGFAEAGDVCVLGAYALYKGDSRVDLEEMADGLDSASETAEYMEKHGLAYTLAWNMVERNDEIYAFLSPEERFVKMLAWIREQIQL